MLLNKRMPVKDSSKGALAPLLLLGFRLGVVSLAGLLAACSRHSPPPMTYATGYVGDRAVVRVWRKDDNTQHSTQLVTLTNALQDDNLWPDRRGVETRYHFVQGYLREIKRTYRGAHPENIHLRFTEDGTVNFMQRQLDDRRERISEDEIALFQFDAKRVLELSEVLRVGNVKLRQGQLQGNRVLTCDGQTVSPDFDALALKWIAEQRQHRPDVTQRVAWLDAPAGTQLLLVAEEDLCQWKPFASE